jgi:hypothetical protein
MRLDGAKLNATLVATRVYCSFVHRNSEFLKKCETTRGKRTYLGKRRLAGQSRRA